MFRKAFQAVSLAVPYDSLTPYDYPTTIAVNIREEDISKTYNEVYEDIGLVHGKKTGAGINLQLKRFEIDFFDIVFRENLANWIRQNAGENITSVTLGLRGYLIDYIARRIEEGATIAEITDEIQRHILSRGFYRWQIERIARTETTAAANYGASVAGDVSGVFMVKEWVSTHDPRTRRHESGDLYDHWDMDGERVGKDDKFRVPDRFGGYDFLRFPGDPKGRAANIINCRCTAGLIPQRDEFGDLVFE